MRDDLALDPAAGAVAGAFFIVDAAFLAAKLAKIADGGYVPLLLAAIYGVMLVWHMGVQAVSAPLQETVVPIARFMARDRRRRGSARAGYRRVPRRTERDGSPVMVWHLKHNRALHEGLFVLTVLTEAMPWIDDAARLNVEEIAPGSGVPRPDAASWSGPTFRPRSRLRTLAAAASTCSF